MKKQRNSARRNRSAAPRTAALALAVLVVVVNCWASEQADSGSAVSTNRTAVRPGPFDESADAHQDIAAALTRAKADGKLVLLDFGANWCPDCVVLSRLFDGESVKPFLGDNFHLVKINVGRKDRNQDLCAKYDAPVSKGIPAIVVLSAEGQVLAATREGELANARTATPAEVLGHLKRWRALRPSS